jgi:hypothetical protein
LPRLCAADRHLRLRLLEIPGLSDVSMSGVKVAPIALERIAEIYKDFRFRVT